MSGLLSGVCTLGLVSTTRHPVFGTALCGEKRYATDFVRKKLPSYYKPITYINGFYM